MGLRPFALGVLALLSVGGVLAQGSTMVEILSKDDARQVFAMSRDEWLENVRQAAAAGVAKATGSTDTGVTMTMLTSSTSQLMVRPDYSGAGRTPDFVQVTVAYSPPIPRELTDKALSEAIVAAKVQMAPEFDVMGNVERIGGGVAIFFVLTARPRN